VWNSTFYGAWVQQRLGDPVPKRGVSTLASLPGQDKDSKVGRYLLRLLLLQYCLTYLPTQVEEVTEIRNFTQYESASAEPDSTYCVFR
jgi:hypothetical protein